MLSGLRISLPGLNKIMTSAEVQAKVDEAGKAMAARAGDGFEYVRGRGRHPWTARGYVQAKNAEAMREQARNATLERALRSR